MFYEGEIARQYDSLREYGLDSVSEIRSLLRQVLADGTKPPYLDLGCGTGRYGLYMRSFVQTEYLVALLDHSLDMLALAKAKGQDSENVYYVLADSCDSPFRSNSVGTIVAVNALHQIPDKLGLMQEIHRVLCPGGSFVLVTPSRDRLRSFPLFGANPNLASEQEEILPGIEQVCHMANSTSLMVRWYKTLRGSEPLPANRLLELIQHRFLSILANRAESDLDNLSRNTKEFLKARGQTTVLPYWSDMYHLRKKE